MCLDFVHGRDGRESELRTKQRHGKRVHFAPLVRKNASEPMPIQFGQCCEMPNATASRHGRECEGKKDKENQHSGNTHRDLQIIGCKFDCFQHAEAAEEKCRNNQIKNQNRHSHDYARLCQRASRVFASTHLSLSDDAADDSRDR